MKITAVEFAVEQLEQLIPFGHQLAIRIILEQAIEMEAKQIENAFDDGWNRANETKQQAYTTLEDIGSNYYNKTFKNK